MRFRTPFSSDFPQHEGQPECGLLHLCRPEQQVGASIGTTAKQWVGITSKSEIKKNEYTKLLLSYEKARKKLQFYVDGALQETRTLPAGEDFKTVESNPKFRVGSGATERGSDATYHFVGEVKDVKFGSGTENCQEVSTLSDLEMNMVEGDLERLIDA